MRPATALRYAGPAALVALLACVPWISADIPKLFPGPIDEPGTLQLLALCLLFGGVALTYDVQFGYTGLLSFGHTLYSTTIDPQQGTSLVIFAFIVVVIGGLGSIRGTLWAAVVVGLVQQYANYYASSGLGDLSVVLLLGIILIVRPGGFSRSFA